MKKILIALAMLAGSLVSVAMFASPAHAACTTTNTKYGSFTYFDPDGSSQWRARGIVNYRTCDNSSTYPGDDFAQVYWYKGVVDKTGDTCDLPFPTTHVVKHRINPNVIGGWNPGEQSSPGCGDWSYLWDAPGGSVRVDASDTQANRCIGGQWTIVRENYPDLTYGLDSLCVI